MEQRIELLNSNITITVTDAGFSYNNFKTIEFRSGESYLGLEISDLNYEDLGQKMFPEGLIPEEHDKKIALLNRLTQELEANDVRRVDENG